MHSVLTRILPLTLLAGPALGQDFTREAFPPGSYGEPFVLVAELTGCFDDEGLWTCALEGEGLVLWTRAGSRTPQAIMDWLTAAPVGTRVLVSGDGQSSGDRIEAVFSRMEAAPEGGDETMP